MATISTNMQINDRWPARSAPELYRSKLAQLIVELGGIDEMNWTNPRWAELLPFLSQEHLNIAYQNKNDVAKLFHLNLGNTLHPQNVDWFRHRIQQDPRLSRMPFEDAVHLLKKSLPKTYSCHSQNEPKRLDDILNEFNERNKLSTGYFPIFSGFLVLEIPVWNYEEIIHITEHIRKTTEKAGGSGYIKKPDALENGIQRIHVYLPEYGLIEFQILHPFKNADLPAVDINR